MDSEYFDRKREERRDQAAAEKVKVNKFVSQFHNPENELSKHTVGLVQLEDFQRIKEDLQQTGAVRDKTIKKIRPRRDNNKLSFDDNEESEPEFKKIRKNPAVDTSFLPDKKREELERVERERLKDIWVAEQDMIKKELVKVQFSYWDGTGHAASLKCPKGFTIKEFLCIARNEWKEERVVRCFLLRS